MFTAARLVAAICLGILGAGVSEMIIPLMPEGSDPGYLTVINFGVGCVIGWRFLGIRAGRGTSEAITNGITAVFVQVIASLLVHGTIEMLKLSMRNRFSEPVEAIIGILDVAVVYAQYLWNLPIIVVLIVGAVLAGLTTEFASRRWR